MPAAAPLIGNIALNLAIGAAFSVASSLLSNALAPQATEPNVLRVDTSRGLSFEMEVGEAVPVSAVLGLARASGQLLYANEYGTDNEFVQFVIKVGRAEHDGLEAFLVDEKAMTLTGSNADPRGLSVAEYTVSGTPYMWVKYYTGAAGQAADPELIAQARPAGRWTADHKLTGCAYMIVTIRYNADLYGSTIPRFGSVWRGLKLFDWREPGAVWGDPSTYVFTTNPAVIRYNFRRGIYVNGVRVLGQGYSAASCDLAGYTAAANRCDESFFDPETNTTFPVFAFGRQVGDDEEKLAVLRELDDAYCGTSFKRGGADVPLPAQQLVSVMPLADTDWLDGQPVRADRKGTVSTKRTMWHGQFVSEDLGWTLAPYEPRIDTSLETRIDGRRAITLDQPFEWLQPRAQLRAEIALRRQLFPGSRVESFGPKALVLEPGDPITRQCEWGSVLMVVEKVERVKQDGKVIGVTLTLREWSNTIVPASGDSFVSLPQGPGTAPAAPDRTIAVSGLSVVAYQREGGGATHPCAKASWTPITDPNVDQVMVRMWPTAGSEVNDAQDFFGNPRLLNTFVTPPLAPETEYTYKAIPVRSDGRSCVWTNTATFTTGAESVVIGDGTVSYDKLAQELKNAHGMVVGSGSGSLAQALIDLQARIEAAALAQLTDQTNRVETFDILKRQNGANSAAIVETKRIILAENAALAQQIDEVAAEIAANLTAGGLFQITATVDEVTAKAEILMKVRAAVADAFSEAAFRMTAEADGAGGSIAYIDIMADRLRFVTTAGDLVSIPFAIETIAGEPTVVMQSVRLRDLTSLDGTTIIMDGETGFVGFYVPDGA